MSLPTFTSFTAYTKIKSSDVNTNFTAITTVLTGGLDNANIATSAAIARSKLASGTNYRILANTSSGVMGENAALTAAQVVFADANGQLASEAALAKSRGGTGADNSSVTFPASGTVQATTPNNHGVLVSGSAAISTVIAPDASAVKFLLSGGASADPTWSKVKVAHMDAESSSLGQVPSSDGSGGVSWTSQATAPSSSQEISNLGLSTSVASNILTIALKQADGSTDPSTGNAAVKIGLRNATSTSGAYSQRSVTAALSLAVPNGATLGQVNSGIAPIWVYALDNAGTVELAVSSTLYDDAKIASTTAVSGSATSGVTIYSTTGRANVPIRLLGRLMNTQTTAGTYASNVSEISLASTVRPKPAPTVSTFTSGSGTYTAPTRATYLKIKMVGGGGGGCSSGGNAGAAGGNTTFGTSLLVANGGNGATNTGGTGGTASLGTGPVGTALTGGGGGGGSRFSSLIGAGGVGGASAFGGAGVSGDNAQGGNGVTNTGGGGGGGGSSGSGTIDTGGGGGAGGYVEALIISPLASYAYAVGAAGVAGSGTGSAGGGGGSGYIVVEEYYN